MRVSKGYPVSSLPAAFVARNKDILGHVPAVRQTDADRPPPTALPPGASLNAPPASLSKPARKGEFKRLTGKTSPLETKFALLWQAVAPDLRLVREHRFAPPRRWKADFAHLGSRTLVECEGLGGGRHQRTGGFIADAEKYLEATLLSWTVVRLTAPQITAPVLERIAAWIRARR